MAPAPETGAGATSVSGPDGQADHRAEAGRPAEARRIAEAGALLVMVAWAANFVIVKGAIEVVPPVGFAFVRFLLAGLVLLALLRIREGSVRIPRDIVVRVALLGGLGFGVYQVLWATGLTVTTAGTSALIIGTTPIWTALVAVAIGTETRHWARFTGAAVGFVGVALVIAARGLDLAGAGLGDLATLVAAICWGSYMALSAPLLARVSPLALTTWAILAGTVVMAVPGVVQLVDAERTWIASDTIAALVYSGVIAAGLANVVIFRAIGFVGASRIANLQLLVPALTVLFAAAILGETILVGQIVGGAVIVAGILVARRAPLGPPPGRPRTPVPPPLLEA